MVTGSGIEQRATVFAHAHASHQDRRGPDNTRPCRPGEGPETEPGGPVNWRGMTDDEY